MILTFNKFKKKQTNSYKSLKKRHMHLKKFGKIVLPVSALEYGRWKKAEFEKQKTGENREELTSSIKTYRERWGTSEPLPKELQTLKKNEYSHLVAKHRYNEKNYSLIDEGFHYIKRKETILDTYITEEKQKYIIDGIDPPKSLDLSLEDLPDLNS